MIYLKKGIIPIQQGQSGVFYVNLPSQSAPIGPTTGNDEEPFDLTDMSAIVASFPGGVQETSAAGSATVKGAPGAGKIKIAYSAQDSNAMQANPVASQNQDLQVVVTSNGVAQVDTVSMSEAPTTGDALTVKINSQAFNYTTVADDTAETAFTAIAVLIDAALAAQTPGPTNLVVSVAVSGSGNDATLVITSTFAGLGFTTTVSDTNDILDLVHTTANAGTIAVWTFQSSLDIQPQPFPVT